MIVVLLEAIILAVGGGLIGWFSGHLLMGLVAPLIEERTGVIVSPFELAPAVDVAQWLGSSPLVGEVSLWVSPELLLVPFLILLAVVVGFLPALSAYRTDVSKALTAVG